eukprot:EG_transcript_9270
MAPPPLLAVVVVLFLCLGLAGGEEPAYTQVSELHPAEFVLLHEPGLEVQLAALHPAGALFEPHGASRRNATLSHRRFRAALSGFGIRTATIREVLLTVPHGRLVALAAEVLRFALVNASAAHPSVHPLLSDGYKRRVLEGMSAEELIDVIVTRPAVELQPTAANTRLATRHTAFRALGNLVFTRDQQITTARGVVLGRPNSPQRAAEPQVTALCWEQLRVPVVGDVRTVPGAFLEGGDFIPMGLGICYIGVGLRTNMKAVEYLMEHDLFGTERVAVVRDDFDLSQDRMHLDTVFNVVDSKRVLVLEDILGLQSPKRRLVDVYFRAGGRYARNTTGVEFGQFLREEGWRVVTVTNEQQLQYMINFVNLGRGLILSVHPDLAGVLDAAGFAGHVAYVDYGGITALYGAAHCTTQVLRLPSFRAVSPLRYSVARDPLSTAARTLAGVLAVLAAAVLIRHSRLHRLLFYNPAHPHPPHPTPAEASALRGAGLL